MYFMRARCDGSRGRAAGVARSAALAVGSCTGDQSAAERGSLSLCTMAWLVIAALMLALYPSSAAARAGGLGGKRPVMGW